jgi:L-aspartate oxidase
MNTTKTWGTGPVPQTPGITKQDHPVIIGAGLAGLMAALHLAPQPVTVLAAAPLGEQAASAWAQGGLSAAIGPDDSPALHLADTLAAGAGLVDEATAARIINAGPALVDELARLGARFDRTPTGAIGLGLEAGHSRRRIVHAQGDSSGREILRAVIAAALAAPHITILAPCRATRLLQRDGAIAGVLAETPTGPVVIPATRVVLATGGVGGLYLHSTNPSGAIGTGLVLAANAGAALADLEFVQFHPTALDVGQDPMPLVSEAVRGEGATLIDETATRFMAGLGRAELEPRDIVSRAVWARMRQGHQVFLDARACLGPRFATRFPAIAASCLAAGIDPATQPIPIRPGAHYFMGGISVDAAGRTTIPGLWACGEAASTGLHGANRLASNSLLEAAITGQEVAADIAGTTAGRPGPLAKLSLPPAPDPAPVRRILSAHAGVLRDAAGLSEAAATLLPLALTPGAQQDPAKLGLMMVIAMLRRQESRGGHSRTDYPATDPAQATRRTLTWAETLGHAAALSFAAAPRAARKR